MDNFDQSLDDFPYFNNTSIQQNANDAQYIPDDNVHYFDTKDFEEFLANEDYPASSYIPPQQDLYHTPNHALQYLHGSQIDNFRGITPSTPTRLLSAYSQNAFATPSSKSPSENQPVQQPVFYAYDQNLSVSNTSLIHTGETNNFSDNFQEFVDYHTPPPVDHTESPQQNQVQQQFNDHHDALNPAEHYLTPTTNLTSTPETLITHIVRDIAQPALRFTSAAHAEAYILNRQKPKVKHDDWQEIEANPIPYVQLIMSSFAAPYASKPEDTKHKPDDQEAWDCYQQEHVRKVAAHTAEDVYKLEAYSWLVLDAVIDCHRRGIKNKKLTDDKKKCSARLIEVAQVIANYTIVRWDVIRAERLEDLASDARGVVGRKMANFYGNLHKKKRDEINANKAKQQGLEYQPVLGSRKSNTKFKSPESDNTTTITAAAGVKSKKRKRSSNFAAAEPSPENTACKRSKTTTPLSDKVIPTPEPTPSSTNTTEILPTDQNALVLSTHASSTLDALPSAIPTTCAAEHDTLTPSNQEINQGLYDEFFADATNPDDDDLVAQALAVEQQQKFENFE